MEISIVVFCLLVAGVVIVLLFCSAFFLELIFPKDKKNKKLTVDMPNVQINKDDELSLDEMLAKLEQKSKKIEPIKKESKNLEEDLNFDEMFEQLESSIKKLDDKCETKSKNIDDVEPEVGTVPIVLDVISKTESDQKSSPSEIMIVQDEEKLDEVKEKIVELKEVAVEEVKPEKQEVLLKITKKQPPVENLIDYELRLQNLRENLIKLDKDLTKSTKELRKFERTLKRKQRNEKLLDKKAGVLANLNLIMYNVNDIKNVDPEKKVKQEELVIHIAELKESIRIANEYLQSNKEKNANARKLNNFLNKEKVRYLEEIDELEKLIETSKKRK